MAMAHSMAGDEILKNTFANNAFEHFEIASYRGLVRKAMLMREVDCARMLSETLEHEKEMARAVQDLNERLGGQLMEQVVVPIPQAPVVQRNDEEVAPLLRLLQDARRHLDQRDVETTQLHRLGHLQADVAAADHDRALRAGYGSGIMRA